MAHISNAKNTVGYIDNYLSEEDGLNGYLGRMFYGFVCGLVIFFVIGSAVVKGALSPFNIPDPVSVMLFFCILMMGSLWVGMAFGQIQRHKLLVCGGLALLAGLLFTLFTFSGMEIPTIDNGIEDITLVSETEET